MNTYLREFVRISIEDWVSFIKQFTLPKYDQGEIWKVQTTPMIVIHLNFKKPESKQEDKKKKKAAKKGSKDADGGPGEESEDEQNRINFHPKLEKCVDFFRGCLQMIVSSTNKVSNLEDDLMPFLQKEKQPNFPITEDFPWVVDAMKKIDAMFAENIVGPLQLLEKYKQYEYILNVDKKALIKELFGGE